MTTTSPPDSTHVDVTAGSQPTWGAQSGCSTRQIQRPAATSLISGSTADILADGVVTMGDVRLEPLYRVEFVYPEGWSIELAGEHGTEWQDFYLAEGTCAGRVAGRMRGANHPRRRTDGTYCPDFQGVIETADGAELMFDWRGYGRAYPVGARQIVLTATHMAEDERYRWLNDVVCVGTGEVRIPEDGNGADLLIDVAELVWEPPGDGF